MEKDVLFPTLICIVYKNDHNYQVLLKEMSHELLVDYLEHSINSYSKQMSFNASSMNTIDEFFPENGRRHKRSQSISSATSSANSIRLHPSAFHNFSLHHRFSVEMWDDALEFFKNEGLSTAS